MRIRMRRRSVRSTSQRRLGNPRRARIENSAPPPGALSTAIAAVAARRCSRLIARPRPVPPSRASWSRAARRSLEHVRRGCLCRRRARGSRVRLLPRRSIQMFPLGHGVAGVEQDVRQNLLQILEVPAHERRVGAVDVDALRLSRSSCSATVAVTSPSSIDDLARARAVRDQIEEVVDQVRRAERLLLHLLEEAVLRIVLAASRRAGAGRTRRCR